MHATLSAISVYRIMTSVSWLSEDLTTVTPALISTSFPATHLLTPPPTILNSSPWGTPTLPPHSALAVSCWSSPCPHPTFGVPRPGLSLTVTTACQALRVPAGLHAVLEFLCLPLARLSAVSGLEEAPMNIGCMNELGLF